MVFLFNTAVAFLCILSIASSTQQATTRSEESANGNSGHGLRRRALSYCPNDYVCPWNSQRKPYRDCYDSFDDCECDRGYYKDDYSEECVASSPSCNYQCPRNSSRIAGRHCYNDHHDCACHEGYKKDSYGNCVRPPPSSYCNYECPHNSYPKRDRDCYDNFDDCHCGDGYAKDPHWDKCIWKGW